MGREQNEKIVERVFGGLWYGASKMEMLEELISPDHVFHFHSPINPIPENGPDGYRQVLEGFAAAFPDNLATIEPVTVSEGDFIVNRWLFEGGPSREDPSYRKEGIDRGLGYHTHCRRKGRRDLGVRRQSGHADAARRRHVADVGHMPPFAGHRSF